MNIKELGLEELTASEKRETKGGVAPIVYFAVAAAMVVGNIFTANAPTRSGGGFGPVP